MSEKLEQEWAYGLKVTQTGCTVKFPSSRIHYYRSGKREKGNFCSILISGASHSGEKIISIEGPCELKHIIIHIL